MSNPNTFAVMVNILAGAQSCIHHCVAQTELSIERASIHMYGKVDARPGRKMGHVTIIANSMEEAEDHARPLMKMVDQIRIERTSIPSKVERPSTAFPHTQAQHLPLALKEKDSADTSSVAITTSRNGEPCI